MAPPVTILLVEARPRTDVRSRAHIEFQRIINRVRHAGVLDRFDFIELFEARFVDVRTALIARDPQIIHVVSQGEADGLLRFESDDGRHEIVPVDQLLRLFGACRDTLRLAFFNAWQSLSLASEAQHHLDLSTGIRDESVPDADAVDFAVAFYEALAYGKTIEKAFNVALASLKDPTSAVLFPPADQDPGNKRQLKLLS